jgi:hypothetical protein
VIDRQSKPPNRITDSLAAYPRLSCEATRKCALKYYFATLRTFWCSRRSGRSGENMMSARES